MELSITTHGYKVTLDTDMGDGATGCWIQKGGFSASLECADATGALQDSNDHEQPISPSALSHIRKWAEANGY
jgi:hypothetical protein